MINIHSLIVDGVDRPESSSLHANKFHMLKGQCRILLQVTLENCFNFFIFFFWNIPSFPMSLRSIYSNCLDTGTLICAFVGLWSVNPARFPFKSELLVAVSLDKVDKNLGDYYSGTWRASAGSWSILDQWSCIAVTNEHGRCCFSSWYVFNTYFFPQKNLDILIM